MTCLLGCMAVFMPRVTITLLVFFSDFIGESYRNQLIPFLGFFFLPVTTIAYAWAAHRANALPGQDGTLSGFPVAVIVVGTLIDVGVIGVGHSVWRRRAGSDEE